MLGDVDTGALVSLLYSVLFEVRVEITDDFNAKMTAFCMREYAMGTAQVGD